MANANALPGREATESLRIIVADDNRDAAASLAAILTDAGHSVFEVYQGDAVVDLKTRFRPDVLILDIGLPGLTGFEIAYRLRRELGHACPLLIAVTAWNQPSARAMGKLSGFKHYLTKPYSPDALLKILAALSISGRAR